MKINYLKHINEKNLLDKIVYLFFFIYFLIGIFIYKDFGLGIEEHFQRKSGFYWLNYILNFTEFNNLKEIAFNKFEEIKIFTPNITTIENHKYYGILFDLPLAFIETFFKIEGANIFFLRHLISFSIFTASGILFYKIIKLRFDNYFVSIFGAFFYLLSPKIFGTSFFDGKDLFFLSILTITFYYYSKYLYKPSRINLLYFALFSAFLTSSRIFGLIIPISFLLIYFFEVLNRYFSKDLKKILFYFFFYFIFLFIHWPFLWDTGINLLQTFGDFKVRLLVKVFYDGEFYNSTNLPYSYVPKSIFFSTPIYIFILFLIGFIYKFKRISFRLIEIKESKKTINNDLWKSKNENLDFFYFMSFILVILFYFTFQPNIVGGWRLFLFCNFFICFFACYSLNLLRVFIKTKFLINIIKIIMIIMSLELLYKLYIFHPYQSLYLNNLVSYKKSLNYEIDTQSLSRYDALKFILKDAIDKDKIKIGTASFTPLEDARSLIDKKFWHKFIFLGTNNLENADYIYTNHIYDIDTNINTKYQIPANFKLHKVVSKNKIRVFSIYKKN